MRNLRRGALAAIVVAMVGLTGCATLQKIIDALLPRVASVENILTRAIADVNANSANWRQTLDKALESLPEAELQVKADVQEVLQRGISHVGIELRCDIRYMGDLVTEGLQRALAKHRGQPVPPRTSVICDSSPSAIDMSLDPNRRNNVEVTGYNLDLSELRLFHVTAASESDVTDKFSIGSSYKRVINLGANGVTLGTSSLKLRIQLAPDGYAEIPVIQRVPRVCKTEDVMTTSSTLQVLPTKTGRGDNDFDGNGACVDASASAAVTGDRTGVIQALGVRMYECRDDRSAKSDYTESYGTLGRIAYTAPHDRQIVRIVGPDLALFTYLSDGHGVNTVQDAGLVLTWDVQGDTDGDDIGKTWVRAVFAPFHLVLRETGDCVAEEQLTRAIHQNALSPATIQGLQQTEPRILQRARELPVIPPHPRAIPR